MSDALARWLRKLIFGAPPAEDVPEPRAPQTYPVPLVGEQYYPDGSDCRIGERVRLHLEPDNRHDPFAIAVRRANGVMMGYIPRDNWLQEVIHDERKGAVAEVSSRDPSGDWIQILLAVHVCKAGDPDDCVIRP